MEQLKFPNPFGERGCGPLAWTHLADGDETFAVSLASAAADTVALGGRAYDLHPDNPMFGSDRLYSDGWARGGPTAMRQWAELAGLAVAELRDYRFPFPRLDKFVQLHREGRWFVVVPGHALALIDGEVFGRLDNYRAPELVIVIQAYRVVPIAPYRGAEEHWSIYRDDREMAVVAGTAAFDRTGWSSYRAYSQYTSREIFVAPDGVEYVRTPTPDLAAVTVADWRTPGLPPLYLKRRDAPAANLKAKEAA